jgi:hypothetical protein
MWYKNLRGAKRLSGPLPDCYTEKKMIKIYSPTDELELAMLRGVLDTEEIRYFVHNDHFGSMRVGPQIDLLNKKTIMAAPEDAERAKKIISDFLNRELPEDTIEEKYTASQKLRMILETLVFGWFIPERRRRSCAAGKGKEPEPGLKE